MKEMNADLPEPEEIRAIAKENRVFSHEQQRIIDAWEKECGDAGCDDNGHKHD